MTEYSKLSVQRKRAIGEAATRYSKENYQQFNTKLDKDTFERLEEIRIVNGWSKAELLREMLKKW